MFIQKTDPTNTIEYLILNYKKLYDEPLYKFNKCLCLLTIFVNILWNKCKLRPHKSLKSIQF